MLERSGPSAKGIAARRLARMQHTRRGLRPHAARPDLVHGKEHATALLPRRWCHLSKHAAVSLSQARRLIVPCCVFSVARRSNHTPGTILIQLDAAEDTPLLAWDVERREAQLPLQPCARMRRAVVETDTTPAAERPARAAFRAGPRAATSKATHVDVSASQAHDPGSQAYHNRTAVRTIARVRWRASAGPWLCLRGLQSTCVELRRGKHAAARGGEGGGEGRRRGGRQRAASAGQLCHCTAGEAAREPDTSDMSRNADSTAGTAARRRGVCCADDWVDGRRRSPRGGGDRVRTSVLAPRGGRSRGEQHERATRQCQHCHHCGPCAARTGG